MKHVTCSGHVARKSGKSVLYITERCVFRLTKDGLELTEIAPGALLDEYSAMVRGLMDKYYAEVMRYTTSGFLRMKLGDALEKRDVAPQLRERGRGGEEPAGAARRAPLTGAKNRLKNSLLKVANSVRALLEACG